MNNSLLREALNIISKRHIRAEEEYENKRRELYRRLPELMELEIQISQIGIEISKLILKKPENSEMFLKNLQNSHEELIAKKKNLLKSAGYPEDYLEVKYFCTKCKDTGYIGNKRCRCLEQVLIELKYDLSNLKKDLQLHNFKNFRLDYYSNNCFEDEDLTPRENMKKILKDCRSFISNFDSPLTENLLFYGNPGLGKTFLAHCIAKELLDSGKLVIYLTAPDLIEKLREEALNEPDQKDKTTELIYTADLLIIDDLGTEPATAFSIQEMFTTINKRLIRNKKMLISTNMTLNEIKDRYSEKLASRIWGHFKIHRFFGEDIRLKKKKIVP